MEEHEKKISSQIDEHPPTSPQTASGDAFVYSKARIAFQDLEELRGRSKLVSGQPFT